MGLLQENKWNKGESEGAEGKSRMGTIKQVEIAKSKETNSWKAEDVVEYKEAKRREDDWWEKGAEIR